MIYWIKWPSNKSKGKEENNKWELICKKFKFNNLYILVFSWTGNKYQKKREPTQKQNHIFLILRNHLLTIFLISINRVHLNRPKWLNSQLEFLNSINYFFQSLQNKRKLIILLIWSKIVSMINFKTIHNKLFYSLFYRLLIKMMNLISIVLWI